MNISKKISLIFLALVNIMNIAAGVITQLKMLLGKDVTSIIPIGATLTVNQILLVNFMAVVVVIFLISVVTTYLVTDIAYSPLEIFKNCPAIAYIIPVVLLLVSIFNSINAELFIDKVSIVLAGIVYLLLFAFNIGAMVTIRED